MSSANAAAAAADNSSGNGGSPSGHMGCQGDQWGYGLHKGKVNQSSNFSIPDGISLSCLLDILGLNVTGPVSALPTVIANVNFTIFMTQLTSNSSNLTGTLELSTVQDLQPSMLTTVNQSANFINQTTYSLTVKDKDLANDTANQIQASVSSIESNTFVISSSRGTQIITGCSCTMCPTTCGGGGGGSTSGTISLSGMISAPSGQSPSGVLVLISYIVKTLSYGLIVSYSAQAWATSTSTGYFTTTITLPSGYSLDQVVSGGYDYSGAWGPAGLLGGH